VVISPGQTRQSRVLIAYRQVLAGRRVATQSRIRTILAG
jgi:hypothetical protein